MKIANHNETVFWLLTQVMFQTKHRIIEIAEAHGLTLMQSQTLIMLKANEPLPMRMLSDTFMCDASNVTGLADRLEARGLIKRQDHPTDRRIKLIALTTEGIELRDKIMAETVAAEAKRLNPVLSVAEREALHAMLVKILAVGEGV